MLMRTLLSKVVVLLFLFFQKGLCLGQVADLNLPADLPSNGMKKIQFEKMARVGKQWFKVETDINCHAQYE